MALQASPVFKEYMKDWGFLSFSKTKEVLDPYFRFKLFSSAKFNPEKYEEDKEKYCSIIIHWDIVMHRSLLIHKSSKRQQVICRYQSE